MALGSHDRLPRLGIRHRRSDACRRRNRYWVTGASGFIAKHVVRQLLDAGFRVRGSVRSAARGPEVTAAVRPNLADPADLDHRLTFVELDLQRDQGWDQAMEGVDTLMHMASPLPLAQPANEDDLIRPAVDGTLRALKAHRSGIGRAIVTSSIAAVVHNNLEPGREAHDERDWTNPADPHITAYVKSKTLAERAAWDYVEKDAPEIGLTTINPVFVLGPPLDDAIGTSLKVVQRLLRAKDPMLPNFGFATVDVRDIATMHVRALPRRETIGRRLIGGERFLWFVDMAKTLKEAYPDRRIVTRKAPNIVVRFLALFDRPIRSIVHELDREAKISCALAREMLDIDFIDPRESLKASADYLIRNDLV